MVRLGGGGGVTGPNRDRARPPGHRGRPCQRCGGWALIGGGEVRGEGIGGGGVTDPSHDRARPPGHRGRPCQRRGGWALIGGGEVRGGV